MMYLPDIPEDARQTPPCPHYGRCGGCSLQEAQEGWLAEWKTGQVRRALEAQGLEAEFLAPHISPPMSRRRAVFAGTRTKKGAIVGFHGRASHTLFPVPDCQVVRPALTAALPGLEALTRTVASRKGEVTITVSESAAGPDVALRGGKAPDGPMRIALAALAQEHGFARLSLDGEVLVTLAAPEQDFDGIAVVPPPGAFLQATRDGEAALRDGVARALTGAKRVADLFAGSGTFALPLARKTEVHAVEGSAAMVQALDRAWRHASGLRPVTTEARDLFRRPLTPEDLKKFDGVAIDPPRAGAEAQCAEIAASGVSRVGFVSCNPVTFARDAKQLIGAGFRIDWLRVVDQFRWSTHIELVAGLSR
ncbi:RNA methyltransferase [Pacificitalea manganoxidans]|uniref:RNA methyltransferase n=1 Tax=Pacificitalea manganoxidans TaxID=1411902 RepID=A0A291LVL9_9RHOB|nr:RsmD family RNA methyltransferase [Pacificitalea manganoxidans]ATI40786.1 RNA methyltransferase [Pacificitalea manganoxidans]MDR6309794.1 23S rRNA (uracil1939-C5)-methyltransferase [Pacificitalea manganoxidans]